MFSFSDELVKVHKYKPTQQWRQKFESYLKTMPLYYAQVKEKTSDIQYFHADFALMPHKSHL